MSFEDFIGKRILRLSFDNGADHAGRFLIVCDDGSHTWMYWKDGVIRGANVSMTSSPAPQSPDAPAAPGSTPETRTPEPGTA